MASTRKKQAKAAEDEVLEAQKQSAEPASEDSEESSAAPAMHNAPESMSELAALASIGDAEFQQLFSSFVSEQAGAGMHAPTSSQRYLPLSMPMAQRQGLQSVAFAAQWIGLSPP